MTGTVVLRLTFILTVLIFVGAITVLAEDTMPIVMAIEFAPTQYLTEEDMRSAVTETKIGQPIDGDKLIADLWAIQSLGTERHKLTVFYDIEVDLVEYGDGVKIVIYPIEMPVIEGFSVDIDTLSPEEFMEIFPMTPGQILDTEALYDAIYQTMEKLYTETGKVFHATPPTLDDANVVHMQFRSLRVASVKVQGNEKTRDFVIEREIKTKIGDPLNVHLMHQDRRRILHLRLFEDEGVGVVLHERSDDPLLVDVVFEVVERKTGVAGLSAGYSSADKFVVKSLRGAALLPCPEMPEECGPRQYVIYRIGTSALGPTLRQQFLEAVKSLARPVGHSRLKHRIARLNGGEDGLFR